MKYLKFFATYLLITVLLVWLGMAFVNWQINPSKWSSVDRGISVFVTLMLGAFALPASSIIEDKP
jgi:hypothetical protein